MSGALQWVQVGSAVFAAIGLLIAAQQVRQSRRTAVLQCLQEFYSGVTKRERALLDARNTGDREAQDIAFVEFANFLELYSTADSGRLLSGVAREFVRDKLIDSIVTITLSDTWSRMLAGTVTSEVTYKHLAAFMRRNRTVIAERTAARKQIGLGR